MTLKRFSPLIGALVTVLLIAGCADDYTHRDGNDVRDQHHDASAGDREHHDTPSGDQDHRDDPRG